MKYHESGECPRIHTENGQSRLTLAQTCRCLCILTAIGIVYFSGSCTGSKWTKPDEVTINEGIQVLDSGALKYAAWGESLGACRETAPDQVASGSFDLLGVLDSEVLGVRVQLPTVTWLHGSSFSPSCLL